MTATIAPCAPGLRLQGIDYWTIGPAFLISLDSSTYYNLRDWQNNAGQERLSNGTPVGFNVDPALLAPGTGGIIGNADLLSSLVAYQLRNGSPLIDTSLNLNSPFRINQAGKTSTEIRCHKALLWRGSILGGQEKIRS